MPPRAPLIWLSENGDPSFAALFSGGIHTFSADFAGVAYASDVRLLAYQGQTLVDSVFGTVSSGSSRYRFPAPA